MIYDIVIIGGGISGLYSAYNLLKNNNKLNIIILEKNDYLGGRIITYRTKINNHKYEFNQGVGRYNSNHVLLIELIKNLGLDKKIIEITSDVQFIPSGNTYAKYINSKNKVRKFIDESPYVYLRKIVNFYKEFDLKNSDKVRTYTFYEYASKILDKEELKFILDGLGYYKQLILMNAVDAIKLFDIGMTVGVQFYSLAGGMDQIVKFIKKDIIKMGGKIFLKKNINNINYDIDKNIFKIFLDNNKIYRCKKCILAVTKPDLLKFNILTDNSNIKRMINSIGYKALCKIYSIFKKEDIWFKDIDNVTTNNKIRYIIPIDKENGLVMISYTDSKFANYWNNLSEEEVVINLKKYIYKTFKKEINDPIFTKKRYWDLGTAFWKKNVDSTIISNKMIQPKDNIPLYICGENYSLSQSWIEGALETSNLVVDKIMKE